MALSRLGDYIELVDVRNTSEIYCASDVRGISTSKNFIQTKADLRGVSLRNYKIVEKNQFAYVADTSRRGDKIGLAYADNNPCIISSIYTVFKVKDESKLLSRYLMMFFSRSEFDRYARFNSWGSARETFMWDDMCDIQLEIPSIEIQKKYVDIYEGLLANLKTQEKGLEDLKLTIELLFDKYKKENLVSISKILCVDNSKNDNNQVSFDKLRGINEDCEFCSTRDSVTENKIDKYRLISNGNFAINFMCLGNFGKFYLAYNDLGFDVIVSPACYGMKLIDKSVNPYYLMAYLTRDEFQRRCVFAGAGNTRGGINFDDFAELVIPIPSRTIQDAIANIYKVYEIRRKNMEIIKGKIKSICPILIRGAVEETKGGN